MVGDAFQLPPVGAGNVLADLIASNTIAIARLTDIYRQSDESLITWNAHLVREGKAPELTPFEEAGDCDSEFYFCEVLDPESASEKICRLCSDWLPRRYRLDPLADIQVLSPVHKGTVGTIDLNQRLQSALNPEGRRIPGTGRGFREGDKVLNLKNNYAKEVYNGDVGRICGIDLSLSTLQVDFDGRIVDYAAAELEELTLGYAISVHKSQGSEYPVVICPVVTRHYVMLQRQLLYTAITRGRSLVILVGSRRAIGLALSNNRPQTRLSALAERLGGLAGLCP
jgi:exodeoxyribonuclease V alpha subunit